MFINKIESNNAPKAIGPYSPAVKLGDFVYLSGQLPIDCSTGLMADDIQAQTHQSLTNVEAILSEMDLETRHITKTTVYMTDLSEFTKMNEIYATFFSEPYPARSCVQVAALPMGAKIEIEALAIDTLVYEKQMQQGCQGGCGGSHDHEGCGGDCDCSSDDEGCGCGSHEHEGCCSDNSESEGCCKDNSENESCGCDGKGKHDGSGHGKHKNEGCCKDNAETEGCGCDGKGKHDGSGHGKHKHEGCGCEDNKETTQCESKCCGDQ